MNIFDDLIKKTLELLPENKKSYDVSTDYQDKIGTKNEIILGKEALFELGGENLASVSYSLFTENNETVPKDEILVIGNDLNELRKDTNFARITIIHTKNATIYGEQALYNILENLKLKQLEIYLKGYMIRTSILSHREQIKVSKKIKENNLSFRDVGSIYIHKLKENKYVQNVKMIFITLNEFNYQELENISNTSDKLFRALNHAISDLKMDCKHCDWQLLCDQVEGMKELHKNIIKQKGNNYE